MVPAAPVLSMKLLMELPPALVMLFQLPEVVPATSEKSINDVAALAKPAVAMKVAIVIVLYNTPPETSTRSFDRVEGCFSASVLLLNLPLRLG